MSFLDLAKKRFSVRKFEDRKVEEEKLLQILEAGRIAPTAANIQPHRIIVVQEETGLQKLQNSTKIYGAPLALIVCADHSKAWKRPLDGKDMVDIDATIITDHMMLQATDLGLGSLWICYFKPDVLKQDFNIPEEVEPVNILALGYNAGPVASPDRHSEARKPMDMVVSYESFN